MPTKRITIGILLKAVIIGVFLGFKAANMSTEVIDDTFFPSIASASGTLQLTGGDVDVQDYTTSIDIATGQISITGNIAEIAQIASPTISIVTGASYGSGTTGSFASGINTVLTLNYTYNTGSTPAQDSDTLGFQVCVTTGSVDTGANACVTGSMTIAITNSYTGSLSGMADTYTFDIGSGTDTVNINVLSNDTGTGAYLSGIVTTATSGASIATGSNIQYSYTGNTFPSTNPQVITYDVCIHTTCDPTTLTITLTGGITTVNDTGSYAISSGEVLFDVGANDTGHSYTLSGITSAPSTGAASITGSSPNQKIAYTYTGSSTGSISLTYQACVGTGNVCDTATLAITIASGATTTSYSSSSGTLACTDDSVYYELSGAVALSVSVQPLANDTLSSVLGSGIFVKNVTQPTTGNVAILTNKEDLLYVGNLGDVNSDTVIPFEYTACESASSGHCVGCDVEIFFSLSGNGEVCSAAGDEDGDGLTNCKDTDCHHQMGPSVSNIQAICEFNAETLCTDNYDNDGDGYTDCNDSNCSSHSNCANLSNGGTEICNNGQDDDGDNKADCADVDCQGVLGPNNKICQPNGETTCDDGFDNDVDGTADCADSSCSSSSACTVNVTEVCNDGIDNDIDGLADCFDPDCSSQGICQTVCGNNVKNTNEECDDGNTTNGDGCSSTCFFETPDCDELTYTFGSDSFANRITVDSNDTWVEATYIDWADGSSRAEDETFPESHSYDGIGTYTIKTRLNNSFDSTESEATTCNQDVILSVIPGCTDPKARNYDANATTDDDSCSYSNLLKCSDINFRVTKTKPAINEKIHFLRDSQNYVKTYTFYPGYGNYTQGAITPVQAYYTIAGSYKPQLIVTDDHSNEITCQLSIDVINAGCTDPTASNYDENIVIDDGSCIFGGSSIILENCGNGFVDPGEECDDLNNYNGDGCDSTCLLEASFGYCGNGIVEAPNEQCDGGPICSINCTYLDGVLTEQMEQQLCFLNPATCQGVANGFLPGTLPGVGPNLQYFVEQMAQKGIYINEPQDYVSIEELAWTTILPESDPEFNNPIFWIKNILPAQYHDHKNYIVIPTLGLVVPSDEITDPQQFASYILGNRDGQQLNDHLESKTVILPGSAAPGKNGSLVIAGHSSKFKHPTIPDAGNPFMQLSLIQAGDSVFFVQKTSNQNYSIHEYRIQNTTIVDPEQGDAIMHQEEKGHTLKMVTCYPLGTTQKRFIAEAIPVSTLIQTDINDILITLTFDQKITLAAKASKILKKHQDAANPAVQALIDVEKAFQRTLRNRSLSSQQRMAERAKFDYLKQYISDRATD